MPASVACDQDRELERVGQRQLREVAGSGQRHERIPALQARWKASPSTCS
jgi:hypothetical protein